jgi:hypothetical protein
VRVLFIIFLVVMLLGFVAPLGFMVLRSLRKEDKSGGLLMFTPQAGDMTDEERRQARDEVWEGRGFLGRRRR